MSYDPSKSNETYRIKFLRESSKQLQRVEYRATPDPSNNILKQWLDDTAEPLVESPTGQLRMIYDPSYVAVGWVEVKTVHGVIRCSEEFYDAWQKHPKLLEAAAREQGFPMRLYNGIVEGLGKVEDKPKKKQHTQPFWTNNWSKK